ncbi:ribosome biogenesis GTP-binding protein YihA/YsxC [Desulfovibrio sp. OttesenSCG-928-F20]|nr:ribosome biogenesis GTP-binding protein YihA/YsxC [Desulfovibrio sp. OttesenSCG-928-M16]MDL2290617.1 ribosome biogenesis GTP-binding protein YihA/YsxC [Desulfovibrio sp. OttesenSCG-928-F20]
MKRESPVNDHPALPRPEFSLEATAFTLAQLVHAEAPQLALAGRSNVGKSSLINALARRKNLAKISATPGKTRSVNYYRIDAGQAFIVDLPGYGYAKCSREERDKWARLIGHYLKETPGLKGLVLLLDARLPPQRPDRDLLGFALALSLPVLPVLTKADKCSKRELQATVRAWSVFVDEKSLLAVSSEQRSGLEDLWKRMMGLLTAPTP